LNIFDRWSSTISQCARLRVGNDDENDGALEVWCRRRRCPGSCRRRLLLVRGDDGEGAKMLLSLL
jgi:hypothetical protein